MIEGQVRNIHIGTCGACGGNVTRLETPEALPRCEQCGAEPEFGPVLPMKSTGGDVAPEKGSSEPPVDT